MKPETLRNRIYQSILYIEDYLDPDNKYKAFRSCYTPTRTSTAVRLTRTDIVREPLIGDDVKSICTLDDVTDAIKNFIEDNEKYPIPCKIVLPGDNLIAFDLSDKELEVVTLLCDTVPNIHAAITSNKILLIKGVPSES